MSTEQVIAMKTHPHLETIRTYLKGCNTSDAGLMRATFTPDVVHYFWHDEPVRTAEVLANFWLEHNAGHRRSTWTLDHGIEERDEAVIEWTQIDVYDDGRPPRISRGAEWYQFRDGKIAEIRPYYHDVPEKGKSELAYFPYAERGYPTLDAQ